MSVAVVDDSTQASTNLILKVFFKDIYQLCSDLQ